MERKLKNLYLLTVKRGYDFYVVAETPNDAENELKGLLGKANWWFSGDRQVVNIKLLATEYHCFPKDKPVLGCTGEDLIIKQ